MKARLPGLSDDAAAAAMVGHMAIADVYVATFRPLACHPNEGQLHATQLDAILNGFADLCAANGVECEVVQVRIAAMYILKMVGFPIEELGVS